MEENPRKIEDGAFVTVQRGDYQRIIQFQSQKTIIFGKGQTQQDILLKNALNQEFYSAFRILPLPASELATVELETDLKDGRKTNNNIKKGPAKKFYFLEKVNEPASKSFSQLTFESPVSLSSGKDNRNIVDDRTSQSLGESDIHQLKDQGLSSQAILTTIISSSKSFAQKTEFSQEKYLKKKEKVHGDLLLFIEPDLQQITEYYSKKDPAKILWLRVDTVSQILSYANIHTNGRYIIYENACGLLVAAVLQRMGGLGLLLHCHAGTNPQKQAISYLNLTKEILEPLRSLDAFYLISGRGVKAANGESSKKDGQLDDKDIEPVRKKAKIDTKDTPMEQEDAEEGNDSNVTKGTSFTKLENEKSLELLKTPSNGLIICGKEHPLSILQRLLPHLMLSSQFVIFSAHPEPLMECYMWAKEGGFGANMHIVDNWMRNIQVETERTHPEINMNSSSGYILFGTYVHN